MIWINECENMSDLRSASLERKINALPEWLRKYALYKRDNGYSDGTIINCVNMVLRFLSSLNESIESISFDEISYEKKAEYIKQFDISSERKYQYASSVERTLDDFMDYLYTRYDIGVQNHVYESSVLPSREEARQSFTDKTAYSVRRIPFVDKSWDWEVRDFERIFFTGSEGGSEVDEFRRRTIFALLMTSGMNIKQIRQIPIDGYDVKKKTIEIHNKYFSRTLGLTNYASSIINGYLDCCNKTSGLLFEKKTGAEFSVADIEHMIEKWSKPIWWKSLTSYQLRCPMYTVLRADKGSDAARKALEYACLYSGHTDERINGAKEYNYGVKLLNDILDDAIDLKQYMPKRIEAYISIDLSQFLDL